jgi:hypothetical protein
MLRAAASGGEAPRSAFAHKYAGPIRAYLATRWRSLARAADIEDAEQDVFLECLKPGGLLQRADPGLGDFRSLLYSVVRNIARRYEERAAKSHHRRPEQSVYLDELPHQAEALSIAFDRAWARSLLRQAAERYEAQIAASTDKAQQHRFRVLQMRHAEGLPIRTIAAKLNRTDVDSIHYDYRRARSEFADHLREVTREHTGATGGALTAECRRLTELVSS